MQADGGLCLQFDAPRRCRVGPTIGSGARAGQSKQADASTRSTAIWAQVDLQSSLLFVGRLGIGISAFQLVFQAKIQTEIKPNNQYINPSIQLTPAHQILKKRRPRTSFFVPEIRSLPIPNPCLPPTGASAAPVWLNKSANRRPSHALPVLHPAQSLARLRPGA